MDSVFSFVTAFIDWAAGRIKKALMTVVHLDNSKQIKLVMNRDKYNGVGATELTSIGHEVVR